MKLPYPRRTEASAFICDSDTFQKFYKDTARQVLRVLCRMTAGNRSIAEDAQQDAYVAMWTIWAQREDATCDENRRYVVGIAAKKVVDWYRRQGRLVELDGVQEPSPIEEDVAANLDERAALAAARELMTQQPPRRRVVVVMHFIEDMAYADISTALGITESTVRSHVEQFRKLLHPLTDRFKTSDGSER